MPINRHVGARLARNKSELAPASYFRFVPPLALHLLSSCVGPSAPYHAHRASTQTNGTIGLEFSLLLDDWNFTKEPTKGIILVTNSNLTKN